MPIHNADIAAIFDEIADLLEIENANPFRVRAYRNASRTVQGLGRDIAGVVQGGQLTLKLPGIGADLAGKIVEIVTTGRCQALEKLRKESAPGLPDLLKLPGLGPKRVSLLYHELDVHTPEQLVRAIKDGRVQALHGFGDKTAAKLLEALEAHVAQAPRMKLALAAQYAEPYAQYLRATPDVEQVIVAGSYRRCRDTVGDLDLLVAASDSAPVMERFTSYDEVKDVLAKGATRATVILKNNLQVDLRVIAPDSFGAALHYFTGSKGHNIAIRRRGQQRGLKISEYGVFKGNTRIAGDTEESVFTAVGLPWIPPELREERGEIEAALHGLLPKLVERTDLQGDLHAHTTATDGHNTLLEMAHAAQQRGLHYLAITEHSKRLTVAHGLDQKRLLQQIEQIDAMNSQLTGFTLLKGIEVDILDDGALDLPDAVLGKLDLVIGAVHSKFNLSRVKQTERILKAMDHRHFTLLAHPTGRLLGAREPYDVDMTRIIRHARERGCFLEINSHPERLDLLDTYCRMAKDEGVKLSINSDAHSTLDFDNLKYGIGQARRGWLEAADVINTRPLAELRLLLHRTMGPSP